MTAEDVEAFKIVSRRTGGLEIIFWQVSKPISVSRRTGGLEIVNADMSFCVWVSRRTGGLEIAHWF